MSSHPTAVIAWLTTAMLLAPGPGVATPFSAPQGSTAQPLPREVELRAIVEKNPSELAPYVALANLYREAGRLQEGEKVLRRALSVHPQTGAVFGAMMTLYGGPDNVEHHERVVAIAEEWVEADPTNADPLIVLGRVHLDRVTRSQSQPAEMLIHADRASQAIDDAMRLRPADPTPRLMGLSLTKLRLSVTDDPAERERLLHELQLGTKELNRLTMASGSGSAVAASARPAAQVESAFPHALRVGGNIAVPTKVKDVKPVFPPEAVQARVQGVVIFEVTIDEAGRVAEARVLRSIPLLDRAAEEAVRQWEFTPTLLNGAPVPVILTTTVQFSLAQQQ